jgi:hypothetical protein
MVLSGPYRFPLITPDGKWLVAIKTIEEGEDHSSQLVRRNLQTGKEFSIDTPDASSKPPCFYVSAQGKVLLGHLSHGHVGLGVINSLLDPETGTIQQVKGEFLPLTERFTRELQPTGNPNEYWAAISDQLKRVTRLGRYDCKNFVFTPPRRAAGTDFAQQRFLGRCGCGQNLADLSRTATADSIARTLKNFSVLRLFHNHSKIFHPSPARILE